MEKSNVSVLVVDDNEMNRDMLSRRLVNEEYIVQAAAGGQEALKLLGVEKFDIILLDIMMPGMDGYELLSRIKDSHVHAETPVLMLTALNERESVVKSIELGAADYLVKPFDMALVKIRIWKSLRNAGIQERYGPGLELADANVLVVDDDDMNRDILSRRVRGLGCQVDVAESGKRALDMLNKNSYHLVLLDINMPEMSGVEVLRTIKANQATAKTAVIMVSGNDEQEMLRECIRLGAADYISKPYNAVVLRARIEPVIRTVLLDEVEQGKEARLKELIMDGSRLRDG
jgi:DNA-binding response OmpR family regulator